MRSGSTGKVRKLLKSHSEGRHRNTELLVQMNLKKKSNQNLLFFLFYKHRIPSKISIPLFEHSQNVMLFDLMHTCTGYPDHMVFSEFRRRFDVLAPHLTKKHGRNYIVKDEKRVSQSTRERGAKCAAPPVPRHSQD